MLRRAAARKRSEDCSHEKVKSLVRRRKGDTRKGRLVSTLTRPTLRTVLVLTIVTTVAISYYHTAEQVQRKEGNRNESAGKLRRRTSIAVTGSKSDRLPQNFYAKINSDTTANSEGSPPKPEKEDFSSLQPRNEEQVRYHVVFSTDCSAYQHWQSYLLFFSAMKVDQPGHVTRIASGCTDEEAARELEWHNTHIKEAMSDRFGLHFTPHFSSVTKDGKTTGDYKYFNKPFGLKHWMEHGEGMGLDSATGKMKDEDVVVILLDPDMILMRPISVDFSDHKKVLVGRNRRAGRKHFVEHGTPFAQTYQLAITMRWNKVFNVTEIAGNSSPAASASDQDLAKHYNAGPPYIATARDMFNIAVKWAEFAPKVHAQYPELLAEMYAYCIAAVHLELPHQVVDSLMVSNPGAAGEAWEFIDAIPGNEVCAAFSLGGDQTLPNVLHYCQMYERETRSFFKYKLNPNIFTCNAPRLEAPPEHWFERSDTEIVAAGKEILQHDMTFMLCTLIHALNEAAMFFEQNHCGKNMK